MARARVSGIPDFLAIFWRLFRRVSSPHSWFPLHRVNVCFYSVFDYVLYWAVSLYLYVAEGPVLYMYMPMMDACTRVVYFLYICHACEVYYCFIICMCSTLTLLHVLYLAFGLRSASSLSIPNLWVTFSLWALHSASRLHHSMVV